MLPRKYSIKLIEFLNKHFKYVSTVCCPNPEIRLVILPLKHLLFPLPPSTNSCHCKYSLQRASFLQTSGTYALLMHSWFMSLWKPAPYLASNKPENCKKKEQIYDCPITASFIKYWSGKWTQARIRPGIPTENGHELHWPDAYKGKPKRLHTSLPHPIRAQNISWHAFCIPVSSLPVIKKIWCSWDNQPYLLKWKHGTCYFTWTTVVCLWVSRAYRLTWASYLFISGQD